MKDRIRSRHIFTKQQRYYLLGQHQSHVVQIACGVDDSPIVKANVRNIWGDWRPAHRHAAAVFYLQSLCPVEAPPDRTIPPLLRALIAPTERVSTSTGIIVTIAVAAAILLYSSLKARRLEINYSAD